MHKNGRKEEEGQKLSKNYLKWINFCLDKILRTATSVDFCVVQFWREIICGEAYLENSTVYIQILR